MRLAGGCALVLITLGIPCIADENCPPVQGLSEHLVAGRVFLLGELHGTDQSPAFARSIACASAASELHTVVGLELTSDAQSMAERYLVSEGTPEDREALLAHTMWTRAYQDGRNSRAMLALIEGVRVLAAEGRRVSLLFFDASSRGPQDREAQMASNLAKSINAHPKSIHVVLTGNWHSRITRGSPRNADHAPMGLLLSEQIAPQRILALDAAHEGGTAWICAPDCGVVQLASRGSGPPGSIEVDAEKRPPGHHGRYNIGTLSASVPAVGDYEPPIETPVAVERATPAAPSKQRTTEPVESTAVSRLQGGWQAYQNGVKAWTIEIDGLAFSAVVGPDDWYRGKIFVRPDAEPAEIDFLIEDCGCGYKGESSDAIYRWNGETITVGTPMPGTPRPTFFNEQKGEVANLIRLDER